MEILVTQVFVFAEYQLQGLLGFVFTIALWVMLRSAMRAEREREVLAYPRNRNRKRIRLLAQPRPFRRLRG